jgi:phage gp36-like protein
MSYATPQRFVEQFGITEASQLLMDTQRQLKPELLQAAMAGSLPAVSATVTQAMLDAATAALAHLVRKLATSSNFMDGYLRSVVQLPLAADDANAGTLEECCMCLTRVSLAVDADNATERMDKLGDQWRTWLKDVSAGRVQLVRSDTGQGPATTHRVKSGQAATGFNWDFHQNFGNQGGQF